MIKTEDECAGCRDMGMPCRGIGCRNRSVKRLYCDECGEDSDRLYICGGAELCRDCLLDLYDFIEEGDLNEQL